MNVASPLVAGLGFLAWLSRDLTRLLPTPNLPYQQWTRLPLKRVRQVAQFIGPWLLTVLAERLTPEEAADHLRAAGARVRQWATSPAAVA